ncbi:ABC transporter ATP-binding protein [Adhaeribacter radiodurans]|uniref:ATP-binding cassette domain-containing protein n=1 Tax=Adhaeribacter radiodurans TaxID=2745197 RepID=A0A7L7L5W5_9BACT|nr:ATP-binding cassette domain-containing protein [Adhaeribacter radiodurans]QMU28212.1 ATP-binding cassette domain-containing protein [Adhaeribacter radiodurans]
MIEVDILKNIKTYNGHHPLRIKTTFATNKITQIFGPSGIGKTTLLKILAGLVQPEQGFIRVNNEVWLHTQKQINWLPQQRKVGFVFQDYALFPHLTVEQHLLYGTPDKEYVARLLAIGQMQAFHQHKPKQLSGGQQQRLAILRALAIKPQILLMDEPFSALDYTLKKSLLTDLKPLLIELQTTCLVVTHYPLETEGWAELSFTLE